MFFVVFQLGCSDFEQSIPESNTLYSEVRIQEVLGSVNSIFEMWGDEKYGPAYAQMHKLYT